MANVKSINLNCEDGSVITLTVGPEQIEIDTPFGKRTLKPQPPAPTVNDIARNPGSVAGTNLDPMEFFPPTFWKEELITPATGVSRWNWAEMYKKYPEEAMDFMKNQLHQHNNPNFEVEFKRGLSVEQRRQMGMNNF